MDEKKFIQLAAVVEWQTRRSQKPLFVIGRESSTLSRGTNKISDKTMLTKNHILEEIRKLAKENGGKPPSTKQLKDKVGIIPYDWQKYWPRLGDAQREAGLTPNTFLKIPYQDDYLLSKFATLIRKNKKWPTKGEIDVIHFSDPKFPGSSIFYNKLGTKYILAQKILEFAKRKKYSDVIKICNGVLEEVKKLDELSNNAIENKKDGSVYMMQLGYYYKIERSKDIGRRYREIKIQFPEELIHIHEIETDDPCGIEAYWHNRFKSKQVKGEWFKLDSSEINAFKRWKRIL